ncbi:hypothetical protein Ctob_012566 [Chrysochromulina tobinii]|uniref:Uncharacterized protein n=1 Tax=Chrysochromulina tobinii TaxID=1460289 RepID=A0A0M0K5P0_9EUKA|nr:hypothetical protein Ctob_012566 [Chrysochromulina tobinii]|eukprot:KOO34135.1 hypothetical protein Ctob_012566 [Chrysochromulina sp. CCMP291]
MPVLTLDDLLSLADEIEQNEQTSIQNEAPGSEDAEERGFDDEEVVLLSRIGQALSEAMSNELSEMDLNDELSDEEHQEIMFTIFDKVLKAVKKKGNKDLDEADLAFVKARIEKEAIKRNLQQPHATKRRFAPLDRVVCRVRGDREWAAGTVQALDQENDDVDPYRTFPYLVKVDPPGSSGVLVPEDTNNEPTGPRVSADGTRELTRMGTCKLRDGLWHVVDHVTRNVRKLEQEVEQCDVD